jgi:activator of 2-hydroxyglutaryl-CoA dehydratase
MRKIKNFKVNLRMKDISRVIRKLINAVDVSAELEETIQLSSRFYVKFLSPSVVYDTFSKESLPFVYEKDIPPKWIAESIFFVTIGSALEEEYKKKENAFGEHTSKIVSAIAVDALEQSKNFVQRIISNEAQDENCEVTIAVDIGSEYYEEVSKVIPVDKIGVSTEVGTIYPKYSSAGLFYWIPSKKKTKK